MDEKGGPPPIYPLFKDIGTVVFCSFNRGYDFKRTIAIRLIQKLVDSGLEKGT